MISDILTGLDKKYEGRINSIYAFIGSALAIVAIISGGKPPLSVLSTTSSDYFGASIPWFDAGQTWISARSWLSPGICIVMVVIVAVAVVLQGWNALRSRSSATLWLIATLAVSRGTDILIVVLGILAVLVGGGLIRQRLDESGFVPATAVLLGLIAAPVQLLDWLCGTIFSENEKEDVQVIGQGSPQPSGAKIVR